tara:strand:+ start:2969 stop:3127 length:159 start_codon:yes stop_codon:yes gene_type:complete
MIKFAVLFKNFNGHIIKEILLKIQGAKLFFDYIQKTLPKLLILTAAMFLEQC